MKILHLAYEDHIQPGSGGGSVRSREINTRLAKAGHSVTVVTASWPEAHGRVEDGVRYFHIGGSRGRIGYFAQLPSFVKRHKGFDLIVEDFGAPFSTIGTPRFTDTPVVAMVQWMFAKEMFKKYRIPFQVVENWGLKAHSRFISVSDDLATEIQRRSPDAKVDVVYNGVEASALAFQHDSSRFDNPEAPILYVGRLDIEQKGLDTLLSAMKSIPGRKLWIIGDGPDETNLRNQASAIGVADRIEWLGRVSGDNKHKKLGEAAVVVVPSNWETFGMVAIEAAAAGTPVVGSNIPCLRDVIPGVVGVTVPPRDANALAEEVDRLVNDPSTLKRLSVTAREFARQYDWDLLAAKQEEIYRSIVDHRKIES